MPRVFTATKSTRGATYNCARCGKPITPGQQYHEWSFRYGGTYHQHAECGRPTRGQLTQSKLAALYDAQDGFDASAYDEPGSLAEGMKEVAETAREIAEEYREAVAAMNMEGSGNENEERADSLESYADELESEADDIEGEEFEPEDPEPEECSECDGTGKIESEDPDTPAKDCVECGGTGEVEGHTEDPVNAEGQTEDEWLEELRDKARAAVENCDL